MILLLLNMKSKSVTCERYFYSFCITKLFHAMKNTNILEELEKVILVFDCIIHVARKKFQRKVGLMASNRSKQIKI
jgi:hypothetical protein